MSFLGIRRRRTVGIAIVGCLAVALSATPALAKKKKKKPVKLGPVVTVSAVGNTASAGAESTAVANCPSGKQVIGGGFSAPLNMSVALVVHDSYRSSAQSWTVNARNLSAVSGAATGYAYCRKTTKSQVTDSAQSVGLSGVADTKTLSPTCPAGTKLVGGGFQSSVGPNTSDWVIVDQNAPGPGSGAWTVTGVNATASSKTLTAHTYCLAGIRTPTILSQSTSGSAGTIPGLSVTTGSCPPPPKPKKGKKGKKKKKKPAQLLSAGGFNGPIASNSGPVPIWSDSLVASPGWKATTVNLSSPGSISITSYGVCV